MKKAEHYKTYKFIFTYKYGKSPIFLEDIDNVLVCNKIFLGERNYKYFIGYLCDDYKIKPLHIMLPKTNAYVKSYDGHTKSKYFLIEDGDFFLT